MSLQGYLPDHRFPCNMFWSPEFAQSVWYNKYGNPEHDLSPKAPCSGQQTVDGKNISQYKCV